MLSNLVTESTTEQSIKVSGEMGPQIKQYTHHLFQMPRSSLYILMSKTAPPLVPVQKTEPWLLKENGAPGPCRNTPVCAREVCAASSEAAFIGCAQQAQRGHRSESHCGPPKLDVPTER